MTTWIGHEMGYAHMINFTFGRDGSMDMAIARQISETLHHQWIFHSLDEASFFFDLEEITRITGGYSYYLPVSHSHYALRQTDFTGLGILHTGQLGDVTLGTYMKNQTYGAPAYTGAISNRFIHHLPGEELREYANLEQQLFLNRGFNFILSGNLPAQQYTESTSPFLDVDFLNFALSLPLEFRVNHRIYKKWIMTKYPEASEFIWDKLGTKIDAHTISIRGKNIAARKLLPFIFQGIKHQLGLAQKENRGMNPFQFWYNSNKEIQGFIEQYFRDYIDLIPDRIIKEDCEKLYSGGNIHEKSMVISLLATIKLFRN
jgi:asparagine synthase (glutamine-hydrolysing)